MADDRLPVDGLGARAAREGERLLAAGELGLARLEFEQALADRDLSGEAREEVRRRLADTRARLGWTWLEKGRRLAQAEAEAADEARAAFEIALSLSGDEGLERQTRAALERLDDAEAQASVAEVDTTHLPLDPLSVVWLPAAVHVHLDSTGDAATVEPEGDEASAVDLALLSYPAEEANELRRLAEADAAIAAALVLQSEGDGAGAVERWQAAGDVAAEPMARREWARACLLAGDTEGAARLLAELPAGDDGARELALKLSVTLGQLDQAAAQARELLAAGRVRDLAAVAEAAAACGVGDQALAAVDARLDEEPRSLRWWGLRAKLCLALGAAEGLREADERAVELYLADYVSDHAENREFPIESVQRLALAVAAQATPHERARGRALAQLLMAHDPDRRAQWQTLRHELSD